MTSAQVKLFVSSFEGFKGFRIVPYTHRIGVITGDGKRHVFSEEKAFLRFTGDLVADLIFSKQTHNPQKRRIEK